jgi:hypothetical protein
MRKLEDVKREILSIQQEAKSMSILDKNYKKLQKRSLELKNLLLYLEYSPSEAFLLSEKERITNLIKSKESQFSQWSYPPTVGAKKMRAFFEKEVGISLLKRQLKTIKNILE